MSAETFFASLSSCLASLPAACASVARLPALKPIFQDAALRFSRKMQETTGEALQVSVEEISAGRIGQMVHVESLCVRSVSFYAEELKMQVLVVASAEFVSSMIEILFSGSPSNSASTRGKGLSKIEMRATDFGINSLADSLADAFSKIVEVSFTYEGAKSTIDWAPLGRKGAIIVVCRCRIKKYGEEADALFLLPRAALDPFRDALARDPDSTGTTKNSVWTSRFQDQVVMSRVTVSAVMERSDLTLEDVAGFKVGQLIALPISPDDVVPLKCGGRRLFGCTLGQKDGLYTVRIEELVNDRQEFLQDVLDLPDFRG